MQCINYVFIIIQPLNYLLCVSEAVCVYRVKYPFDEVATEDKVLNKNTSCVCAQKQKMQSYTI